MLAGSSGRYHIGFKAQQVERALLDSGLTTKDFAGLVKTEYTPDEEDPERTELYESVGIKPGDVEYGVIYNEFVAMNTYQIKNLKERVCEQEQEFDYLRGQVETLTNMLQELYMQLYGTSTLNAET